MSWVTKSVWYQFIYRSYWLNLWQYLVNRSRVRENERKKERKWNEATLLWTDIVAYFFFGLKEEMEDRPKVATMVSSLANYSATVTAPTDPDAPDRTADESPKLGTLTGVFFPCLQNIFGVILFIRMTWIIGTAGIVQGFFIIGLCCTCVSGTQPNFLRSILFLFLVSL